MCQKIDIYDTRLYNPDTIMGLSITDRLVAESYADKILTPIAYGENGVFFWFPGSGMTTVVQDIFANKGIVHRRLSGLANRLDILQFWGNHAKTKSLDQLIKLGGFSDHGSLERHCEKILKKGKEVVFVIGRIDNFGSRTKLQILKFFVKVASYNTRRIHILFMSMDKPWFEKTLLTHPEFTPLANHLNILPLLDGKLLNKFINEKMKVYDTRLSGKQKAQLVKLYGGILLLIKHYLRSGGDRHTLDLKIGVVWDSLPNVYKKCIEKCVLGNNTSKFDKEANDLKKFGALKLNVFKRHYSALSGNPEKILPKFLTEEEEKLWKTFHSRSRKLVEKEEIINILRPKKENVSLWAIDQAMSRFRKKLARAGIDPEQLKTVKGKGYIWNK